MMCYYLNVQFQGQRVNMYLVINKCITALILKNYSLRYLRNRSTSDTSVFSCIDVI